jgi:hypothetical protein
MSSSPYDPYIPSGQNSQAGTPNLHGTPGLNNTPGLHGTPGFQGSPSFGNPQSPQGEDGRKTIHQVGLVLFDVQKSCINQGSGV